MVFQSVTRRILLKRMKSSIARKFDQHTAAFNWDKAMNARPSRNLTTLSQLLCTDSLASRTITIAAAR